MIQAREKNFTLIVEHWILWSKNKTAAEAKIDDSKTVKREYGDMRIWNKKRWASYKQISKLLGNFILLSTPSLSSLLSLYTQQNQHFPCKLKICFFCFSFGWFVCKSERIFFFLKKVITCWQVMQIMNSGYFVWWFNVPVDVLNGIMHINAIRIQC